MSEKSAADNQEISDNDKTEEYLAYFLKRACEPDEHGRVPQDVLRATVDSILLLHSGELVPGVDTEQRNEAINKIQAENTGMPRTKAEVSDTTQGALKRFNMATWIGREKPLSVAKSTYIRMKEYWQEAEQDSKTLTEVMTVTDSGNIVPNLTLFRQEPKAVFAVAGYLQARDYLDHMRWPARNTHEYKDDQKYWRGLMLAAAVNASPSVLAITISDARQGWGNRLRYWSDSIREIDKTVGGGAVKQAIDAELQAKDRNEVREEEKKNQESDSTGTGFSTEDYIPEEHRKWLEERQRLYAERVEDLDHDGMPQAEKQAILEREFPEFTSVQRATHIEVQEQLRQNTLRALAGGTHPSGPRGKKRFFDNENARADSDRDQS